MEQNRASFPSRVRVVVGIFVALVIAAVCLHDLVEFRAAHNGALWPPKQLFGVFAYITIPLACILYGAMRRQPYTEVAGWIVWGISIVVLFV
jgi:hypothetical protein